MDLEPTGDDFAIDHGGVIQVDLQDDVTSIASPGPHSSNRGVDEVGTAAHGPSDDHILA